MVTEETEVAAVDFALKLGARVSGTVRSARSGEPARNTAVRICGADGTTITSVRTDENGFYTTPALRDGLYYVSTELQQNQVMFKAPACDLDTSTAIQLVAGDHQLEVNLTAD